MKLELRGARELIRRLERLAEAPKPNSRQLAGAMRAVGEALVEKTAERFETERDPYGTPWRPLSPVTLAINPRRAGGRILSDTARLRRSINYQVRGNTVEVGTPVHYAKYHQGDPTHPNFPGRKVPRRPFLPWLGEPNRVELPDDYLEEIRETLSALWEDR